MLMENTEFLALIKLEPKTCPFCERKNGSKQYTVFLHNGLAKFKCHLPCIQINGGFKVASQKLEQMFPKELLLKDYRLRFKKEQSISQQESPAGTPSYDEQTNLQPAEKAGNNGNFSSGGQAGMEATASFNKKKKPEGVAQ